MKKCKSCSYKNLCGRDAPCDTCDKTSSNWRDNGRSVLRIQLEIVAAYCNGIGLTAGAEAVKEAIKLIRESDEL